MTDYKDEFKKKAFIPYVLAFYPNEEKTIDYVDALIEGGASLIEIGIPFSDPIAEGPTILAASQVALDAGYSISNLFILMDKIVKKHPNFPFVFMTYLNPVFHYGYDNFFNKMKELGLHGIIIPDLPYDEAQEVKDVAVKYDVNVISLIAPTSINRIKMIAENSTGFIYMVSSLGVTGARDKIKTDLNLFVSTIKKYTDIPVAVGFGIKDEVQANKISKISDGIIIGSKIIDIINTDIDNSKENVKEFARKISEAIK